MSAQTIDMALLERAVSSFPADVLAAVRQDALRRFGETGFPHTRQEDWKYTSLAPAVELSNEWLRGQAGRPARQPISTALRRLIEQKTAGIAARWIVIANGAVDEASLDGLSENAGEGFTVRSAALRGEAPPVSFGEPMSRFNAALLRDVLHFEVPAGRQIDEPIGLLIVDDAGNGASVSQTRIVIELADNASARFIELHATTGNGGHFANVVTEVRLGGGAQMDFVRIQQRDAAHFQVGRLAATLEKHAVLNHVAFDLGGALVRNDIAVDITEPGATVNLHGLYLAGGRQHIDNHTRIDHRVGPAKSVEEYRGILHDRARCVFNGKAIVHRGADGTDAHQANHNLLLSEKTEIDTKPELEIYADDVKCSHGATVGQLDATALFYLQSRGIDREYAARLLTRAFATTVVERVPIVEVHSYIETAIEKSLQAMSQEEAGS